MNTNVSKGIFYNPEDCGSYVICNSDNEGGIKVRKVGSRNIKNQHFDCREKYKILIKYF